MSMESGGLSSKRSRNSVALGLTVLGALARLMPHPPNFTPVGGMSLFAGARLRGWQAYAIPLLLMAVTDPILAALYGYPMFRLSTPVIYGSFLINVWIGRWLLRKTENPGRIAAAAVLCSTQFFVLTNFAVWLGGTMYPVTWAGLIACYVSAIPFFGRTLGGDLFYTAVLFSLQALLARTLSRADQKMAQA